MPDEFKGRPRSGLADQRGSGGPQGPGPGVDDPELPAGLPTYPGPGGPEGGPQGTS